MVGVSSRIPRVSVSSLIFVQSIHFLPSPCSEFGAIVMERDASAPSDPNSKTSILSISPPPTSILAPHSPSAIHFDDEQKKQQFSTNFTALYRSIFPPKSPPSNTTTTTSPFPRSSASSTEVYQNASSNSSTTTSDTDRPLELARLGLAMEYENLRGRFNICRAQVQDLTNEINFLRRENASLRITKTELVKLLSLSSQTTLHDCFHRLNLIDSGTDIGGDELSSYSPTSVVEESRFERAEPERVWLPRSISVRSSTYLKANQLAGNNSGSSRAASQLQMATELEAGKVSSFCFSICITDLTSVHEI